MQLSVRILVVNYFIVTFSSFGASTSINIKDMLKFAYLQKVIVFFVLGILLDFTLCHTINPVQRQPLCLKSKF